MGKGLIPPEIGSLGNIRPQLAPDVPDVGHVLDRDSPNKTARTAGAVCHRLRSRNRSIDCPMRRNRVSGLLAFSIKRIC